jgi:DMSO/TMAO reductase YedYZ molybdopterin-dependent catalytic subunit
MKDEKTIISPDTERKNRIPPGQRITRDWPVLQSSSIHHIDTSEWTFSITGLVVEERKLDYQHFLSLERVRVFSDIHCVTTWSRLDNLWEGPSSRLIKVMVEVLPEAGFVVVHAAGGFTTNLTLADFLEPDVLFALKSR